VEVQPADQATVARIEGGNEVKQSVVSSSSGGRVVCWARRDHEGEGVYGARDFLGSPPVLVKVSSPQNRPVHRNNFQNLVQK
jgi:hypothetical protein